MSTEPESQRVSVDVLPPVPKDAPLTTTPPLAAFGSFYHPASGVVILALDWLAFGSDLMSGMLALPLVCVVAFLATFPSLYLIQTKWSQDKVGPALGNSILGAFLVALPFPITGTLLGAAVLALSGLPKNPVEALKKLTEPKQPEK